MNTQTGNATRNGSSGTHIRIDLKLIADLVPTGARVNSFALEPGALYSVTVPIIVGIIGTDFSVTMSRVVAFTAFGINLMLPKNLVRTSQSSDSFMMRLMPSTAAWALNTEPSWYFTPCRKVKRQVVSLTCRHEVARRGLMLPSFGSISVRVSAIFCFVIRPTVEREDAQGSTISGSSESTMVTVPACCASAGPAIHKGSAAKAANSIHPVNSRRNPARVRYS